MNVKNTNNEINILDAILIVWKKKWNIALIVTVALILVFLFYQKNDTSYDEILVRTEIRPITHYEEGRYKIFNYYIASIKDAYNSNNIFKSREGTVSRRSDNFKKDINNDNSIINSQYVMEYLLIDDIDKTFLFNLFIDKLKQKQFLADLVIKSNFIEEKNYVSSDDYNMAVTNLVSQIKILEDEISIQFRSQDLKKWENFLSLIEVEANLEIQKNLTSMVSDYLNYLQKMRIYKIQDIDFLILIATEDYERVDLEKKKKFFLNSSEFIKRMKYVYSQSPISQSSKFHAAIIDYAGSEIKKENSSSPTLVQVLTATGIFSVIFGIFFVLILNAIKNRK